LNAIEPISFIVTDQNVVSISEPLIIAGKDIGKSDVVVSCKGRYISFHVEVIEADTSFQFTEPLSQSSNSDIDQSPGFLIYPNPAHKALHIKSKDLIANSYNYSIYDAMGKVYWSSYDYNGQLNVELDVSFLNPGIYFIQINADNRIWNERFLIVK
jgi:hypothetical protein